MALCVPNRVDHRTPGLNRRVLIARVLGAASLGVAGAVLSGCGIVRPNRLPADPAPRARSVAIVGAGIAGLAAAAELRAAGLDNVVVLEARDRIGGRICTSRIGGYAPVDLGASWIHGIVGNPIAKIAAENDIQMLPTNYGNASIHFHDSAEAHRSRDHILLGLLDVRSATAPGTPAHALRAIREHIGAGRRRPALPRICTEYGHRARVRGRHWRSLHHKHQQWQGLAWTRRALPRRIRPDHRSPGSGLDIRTGQAVAGIDYRGPGVVLTTAVGETFEATSVIVTVPLGILKKGTIAFMPGLPPAKRRAIDGLGMGVLNKTCLLFDDVFWPSDVERIGYVGARPGQWAEAISLYPYTRQPILMMFNAGAYGVQTEAMTDTEVVSEALAALVDMYGSVPPPKDALITRWGSDPWSYGSYSYVPVGSSFGQYAELAGRSRIGCFSPARRRTTSIRPLCTAHFCPAFVPHVSPRPRYSLPLWQGADAIHPGDAAVSVFPQELFTVTVSPHHHRSPAEHMEIQDPPVPDHAGGCSSAIGPSPDSEGHGALGVVGVLAQHAVRAVIVNDAAAGDDHPASALFDAFYMADVSTIDPQPQARYVIGSGHQRFGASGKDRQREVGVAATWGIALRYVPSQLAAAIELRGLAVVDRAAVAGERRRIGRERWSR